MVAHFVRDEGAGGSNPLIPILVLSNNALFVVDHELVLSIKVLDVHFKEFMSISTEK